jgi:hypothetical protein
MSRKLYAAFVPLLAVIAFAVLPATSQAAFHWYKCEHFAAATHNRLDNQCTEATAAGHFELKQLPFTSAKTQVITYGTLTLKSSITVTCKVIDAGNIWNTTLAEPGKDNVEVFVNYECTSPACTSGVTITSSGLPWPTELAAGPTDKIKGVEVTVDCVGVATLVFTGELAPKFVNTTSAATPSFLEFTAATGTLKSGTLTGEVIGNDRIHGFENVEGIMVANP